MKLQSVFKNMTIKRANIFTMIILFIFTMLFVSLLVDEMYQDYETALHKNITIDNASKDLSNIQAENKKQLKTILIKTILSIVTLAFIVFALALGLYKILNSLVQRDIEEFLYYFKNVTNEEQTMDRSKIFFDDFKFMVSDVNKMVKTISAQKKSLQELNIHLEDRVETKTKTLKKINENLEQEKVFSQELLRSQKEFLRYTVHETNTPLSVILTNIELYSMKNKKDRQLSKIEAAVKNIFNIYDDLSYLVKKDQVEYPKVVINFEKYLGSRIDFFQEVAQLSRVSFSYKPSILDAHIYFNETKLQRIIDNTITNAIKYTLVGEEVEVNLEKSGPMLKFSMGSKSKSIENPEKLFEPFYREAAGSNRDGFGLGLQLVRSICEEENVIISVNSKEKYTIFSYKFTIMGD